jgi:hypothetical protein
MESSRGTSLSHYFFAVPTTNISPQPRTPRQRSCPTQSVLILTAKFSQVEIPNVVLFILMSLFFILRVADANLYLRGLIRHGVPLHEIPTSINDLMTGDNQHRRLYQKIVQGIAEGSVQMAEVAHDNGAISLLEMCMIFVAVAS